MTKIVIPDDMTIFHSEAKRLREERDALRSENDLLRMQRDNATHMWEATAENVDELKEELAKVREVNAEQANQIAYWRNRAHHAEDQLRRAQQDRARLARSGE